MKSSREEVMETNPIMGPEFFVKVDMRAPVAALCTVLGFSFSFCGDFGNDVIYCNQVYFV